MKHEQSAPAGYRPRFDGATKLYLVRHKEYGELTVNGVNKYEAVHAAAVRGAFGGRQSPGSASISYSQRIRRRVADHDEAGAAETSQTAPPPDASRYPPLARPRAGAHYRAPGGQGTGDAQAGNPARGGTAKDDVHSTGSGLAGDSGGGNNGGARGADGRAGAREQIRGAPFQRRGRLYPCLPRLPRGARRELRGTSRRRRGRSKPYALRLFPGYGRGGRISEIRRRVAVLPRSVPLLGGAGQGTISRGAYRHRGAGAHSFRGYGLFFDRAL